MTVWTLGNTEGFTATELGAMNEATAILLARGWEVKHVCDVIMNTVRPGVVTSDEIVRWALLRAAGKDV